MNNLKRYIALFVLFALFTQPVSAVTRTYTVNYAVMEAENPDTSPGDGVCVSFDFGGGDIKCTLTGAIDEAKANPGDDITILFDSDYTIGAGGGFVEDGYAWKITPDAGAFNSLTIDGGANTIQLSPGMSFADTVFGVIADNVTLKNLYIYDQYGNADGIYIDSTSDNTSIDNVTLGLTSTGTVQDLDDGVSVSGQNNEIINSTIAGNAGIGIRITATAKDLTISNNLIGTDESDTAALGNATAGIMFTGGMPDNLNGGDGGVEGIVIGGNSGTDRNVIVSNGVGISFPSGTLSGDLNISNNYIGLASDGTTELANTGGVQVDDNVADGLDITMADNLISGNVGNGVYIRSGNTVTMTGNGIGVDVNGDSSPNTGDGAYLDAITLSIGTLINGNTFGYNSGNGLQVNGDDTTVINLLGNTFNSNALSGAAVAAVAVAGATIDLKNNLFESNTGDGFNVNLATGTATLDFGSDTDGEGNRVRSNGGDGVELAEGLTVVTFHGNRVGLNEAGTAAAANTGDGVKIDSSTMTSFVAGTVLAAARNVISGNLSNGVYIVDMADAATATFKNNYIGLATDGASAIANAGSGVEVDDGNTTFGSTTAGEGNVISGNTTNGIYFNTTGTLTASILGNYIGVNALGTAAVANANGLKFAGANVTATIGAENGGNVIAGNTTNDITASSATSLTFYANKIGVAADGTTVISNNTNPVNIGTVGTLVFGGAGVLKNTVSNTNAIGVLLTGMTTTALDAINTWTVTTGPFAETGPKFWYWKDTSTHSPTQCADSYDNDGDGVTDLSDPGCPSATGDNEASADPTVATVSTGGASGFITSRIQQSRSEATEEAPAEEAVAEEEAADEDVSEEVLTEEEAAVAAEAAEVDERVEEAVVEEPAPVAQPVRFVPVPVERPSIFKDQTQQVDELIENRQERLEDFEDKAAEKEAQPEEVNEFLDDVLTDEVLYEVVQYQAEDKIEDIFDEKSDAGLVPVVRGAGGRPVEITDDTRVIFEPNYEEAVKLQVQAEKSRRDVVVMTSFSDFDQNGVADLIEIGLTRDEEQGGKLDDGEVSLVDKIFFGEVSLFDKKFINGNGQHVSVGKKSLKDIIPEKLRITNYPSFGANVGSEIMTWIAGGEVGDYFEVVVIDKDTGEETLIGSSEIDEGYKGVMPVKFPGIGEYYVVVQDKSGEGSVVRVNVDPALDDNVDKLKLLGQHKGKLTEGMSLSKSLFDSVLLSDTVPGQEAKQLKVNQTLTGYAEPGTMVFVTWQSTVYNSVVIADAGEGYYEIPVPEKLASGNHKVTVYNYNKDQETFSGMLGMLFRR